ncbi:50S ribosomal subunit protein L4 [Candidatus Hodgkinia cicadicola]|nr:50S ribosomal subunit protein L4 [Candidatus Hodgkinia cicadicola]
MISSNQTFFKKTPWEHDILASEANFKIYPRHDVISSVVRWQLDKRRWYFSQIKSRADINCSGNKKYRQKGSGFARHATMAVCQFRGGGKYVAKKCRRRARLNKKFKILALRSCLSLKCAENNLHLINTISQFRLGSSDKSLLVYNNNDELKTFFRTVWKPKLKFVQWTNLNVLQVMSAQKLIFTKSALEALNAKLICKRNIVSNV